MTSMPFERNQPCNGILMNCASRLDTQRHADALSRRRTWNAGRVPVCVCAAKRHYMSFAYDSRSRQASSRTMTMVGASDTSHKLAFFSRRQVSRLFVRPIRCCLAVEKQALRAPQEGLVFGR